MTVVDKKKLDQIWLKFFTVKKFFWILKMSKMPDVHDQGLNVIRHAFKWKRLSFNSL